jgi:hypothetical protein
MRCQLNLYHKGIPLYNYPRESGTGHELPGTIPHPTLPPEKRLSWVAELKRHLAEAKPDMTAAWDAPANAHLASLLCEGLICPSSGHGVHEGLGQTSYVGVAGIGADAPLLPLSSPRAGYFGYDRVAMPSDIKRGMSNVLIVLETSEAGPWLAGGQPTVRGIDTDALLGAPGGPFGSRHRRGAIHGLRGDGSGISLSPDTDPVVLAALATLREETGPE